jgi:hypothetical protein
MLILSTATMVFSSLSFGSIFCDGTPTAIATISAAGGCYFGTNLFTNVTIGTSTESATTSTDAIDPTKVQLAFTRSGNVINVIVSDSNTTAWTLTGTQQFNLILKYDVTGGLPAYFMSVGDSFNGSGTSNTQGAGNIAFDKTADSVTLPTLSLLMMSNPQTGFPAAPLSTFSVNDNIQVHATNATATLVDATNSFVVPEPMSSMLLGSGLLAFGVILRRKRK